MTAWDELQQWLMMNVGSKEAEECLKLLSAAIDEKIANIDPLEQHRRFVEASIKEHQKRED